MRTRLKAYRDRLLPAPPPRYNDSGADKASQVMLQSLWTEQRLRCPEALPRPDDVHLRYFSQNFEDGALLYLFSVIGTTNRVAVEMCCGVGFESNSANLIVNHGWHGLLFEGDADNVAAATAFFGRHPDTWPHPPQVTQAWITRDNVNDLIRTGGVSGEVDLFSLDMDGVDYWIWDALDAIDPRVVVVEYNDIAGPDRSVTVPYSDDFAGEPLADGFVGASLRAFTSLAERKGYRLVGCERWGFNAFFVREDLCGDLLPARRVEEFFDTPKVKAGMAQRWPRVADRPWQVV